MLPRRKGKLTAIRDLVPGAYPRSNQQAFLALCAAWNRVVPPRIRNNAQPSRFDAERGRLTISALSSTWAMELDYMSESLIADLRKAAPRAGLRFLRFRVGVVHRVGSQSARKAKKLTKPSQLPDELARELARIPDDELRAVIADAASHTIGREEAETKRAMAYLRRKNRSKR